MGSFTPFGPSVLLNSALMSLFSTMIAVLSKSGWHQLMLTSSSTALSGSVSS
jgi:hypothetical protein